MNNTRYHTILKRLLTAALFVLPGTFTHAQQLVVSAYPTSSRSRDIDRAIAIDSVSVSRHGSRLNLQMTLALMGSDLPKDDRLVVTPRLVADDDSLDFPSVVLFGRRAAQQVMRSGVDDSTDDMHFLFQDARAPRRYSKPVAYAPWMEQARLKFIVCEVNGCDDRLGYGERLAKQQEDALTGTAATQQAPVTEAVENVSVPRGPLQHYEGTAYIDYPLNSTEVLEDFNHNAATFARIRATLDSVLHNERALLQRITIKGYASPEGTYAHNEELASGRVRNLRRYLTEQMGVPYILITVDFEPEDWDGLRRAVKASSLPDRDAVMEIINTHVHPDERLARLVRRYPAAYAFLLDSIFPTLRRTDYRIDYLSEGEDLDSSASMASSSSTSSMASISSNSSISSLASMPQETFSLFDTYRPVVAVKSNLLFDAALAPNVEVELPLGDSRWSVMGEVWFPWWRLGVNPAGYDNPYYVAGQRPTRHAYELLLIGAEARYWLLPRCPASRPALSGLFIGIYGAGGKYDLGYDSKGDQGEFTSLGLSVGYSWPLARHWNLEASLGGGYVGGPTIHYQNEFDDTHHIYRYQNHLRYLGPTKAKLSLVYLFGKSSQKGGER